PKAPALNTPALPTSTLRFVLHFFWRFRWWYALIMLLEIFAAVSGILMPYAIGKIVGVVADNPAAGSANIIERATYPLLLFVALSIGELVFNRASGACRVIVTPRQRTGIARDLYAYLQRHSHRYISN